MAESSISSISEPAFGKGLTFKMGQTNMHKYMPKVLREIENGRIDPSFVISHRVK
jgi:threonine dehydrogenase-like Zn-dependent dehydrogenase